MKVEVRDAEKSRKELSIEIPPAVFDRSYEKKLSDIAKSAKIPGFRQGKAPVTLVEKQYQHKVRVETLEKVINDAITEALKDNKINPLSMPHLEDVKFGDDKAISFRVFVDVFPSFDISKYKGYDFEMLIEKIDDKDVSKELEAIRLERSTYEPENDDATVKPMDLVTLDYMEDFGDSSEESKDFTFVVDNNYYHKDFNDHIKGMKKNEAKVFSVTYPADHPEVKFAGKAVTYTVTVKEIKNRVLPELNDEFAKEINEECKTLDELKRDITEKLQNFKKSQAKERVIEKILHKIIEENPFDVPQSFVDRQAEQMLENLIENYKRMYGEEFLKDAPLDKMKKDLLPSSEFQVKSALIVNKISEKENIVVADEELDVRIKEYASTRKIDFDKLKKEWQEQKVIQNLKDNLIMNKVYDFLVKSNNVNEKYVEKEIKELEKNIIENEKKMGAH
jgi:trigger factor